MYGRQNLGSSMYQWNPMQHVQCPLVFDYEVLVVETYMCTYIPISVALGRPYLFHLCIGVAIFHVLFHSVREGHIVGNLIRRCVCRIPVCSLQSFLTLGIKHEQCSRMVESHKILWRSQH